jgi:hypothetical protein
MNKDKWSEFHVFQDEVRGRESSLHALASHVRTIKAGLCRDLFISGSKVRPDPVNCGPMISHRLDCCSSQAFRYVDDRDFTVSFSECSD